ncbi:MAG: ankyrin repeat domain-containing protein, partial [Burkholderiales bacterium]
FKEPVIAEDGHTYEKEAITKWVKEKGTSPKTREKISNRFFTNWDKKSQIAEFLDEHKLCSQAAFIAAIKKGNVKEVRQLNYLEDYLEAKDDEGLTPLHIAAQSEQNEMVMFLLNQGANIEAKTNEGSTPLHLAVSNEAIVDTLLKAGAKINAQTNYGENALHLAAYKGYLASCKLLIQYNINLNLKASRDFTALHYAIEGNQIAVVEYLMNVGAYLQAKTDFLGLTPLHLAIVFGNFECVQLLLEQGADIETKGRLGGTPLHVAARKGQAELVKLLLSKGAQLQVQDGMLRTPLHLAVMEKDNDVVVKLLLDAGASINALNEDGNTPLHIAAGVEESELIELVRPTSAK